VIITDIAAPYPERVHYRAATETDLNGTRELVEKAGGRCVSAVADVRDRAALQAAVDAGLAAFGRLDIVVANAGVITFHDSSLEITDDIYDLVVDTCLKGVWNTIQVTAPPMIEAGRGGAMIPTSSAAGLRGQPHYAHYGLMRTFANELAEHRIRVNTVHPSGVSSPGMGSDAGVPDLYARSRYFHLSGMNMLPDLDSDPSDDFARIPSLAETEIANAVLFLASDEARYITGVTLPVDAGNTNKP